jgi:hypothetical protein
MVVAAAVAWAVGCSRSDGGGRAGDDDAKVEPAPATEWSDFKLKLRGMSAEASFIMTEGRDEPPLHVSAYFRQFPKNTEVVIGDARHLLDDRGYWLVKVDVRDRLGAMSVDEVIGKKVTFDIAFTIDMPGYERVEGRVPPQRVDRSLREALVRSRGVGLAFKDEPAARPKPATAIVVDTSSDLRRIGPLQRMWDIDWVAVEEREAQPAKTKRCSGYDNGDLTLELTASLVTIHERRTGKIIEKKRFEASDRCPSFASVSANRTSPQFVSKEDIDRWVRDRLK